MINYGDGKAGQFAKSQAERLIEKLLGYLYIGALAGGVLPGMALGVIAFPYFYAYLPGARSIPRLAYWGFIIGLFVLSFVYLFLLLRLTRKPLDELTRERVRYLLGGQTEALVAYSMRNLGDDWHLFNNVAMKGGGDVDHVLIGPGGVFCISTKSHRGLYQRDSKTGKLSINGHPSDQIIEAQRLALKLRNWLEALLQEHAKAKSVPYVRAVLMVPYAHVDFPSRADNVWVVDEREFLDILEPMKRQLGAAELEACVSILKRLTGREPKVAQVA